MKLSALLIAALTLPAFAENQGWVNFIRQNQLDTGLLWDMPVSATGQSASPLALEKTGALFQLWAIKEATQSDFLLDQKLVGVYLPSASIVIETGDPYPHRHRTRADQPYTVKVMVDGLLNAPDIPNAATQVLLEKHLAPYQGDLTQIDPRTATSQAPSLSAYLASNGSHEIKVPFSTLPSEDPTKAYGEEHFVVHALADAPYPQTQIAWGHVQIWPVATAWIEGIEEGQTVRFNPGPITLYLEDLYPASTSYVQIYKGAQQLNKAGKKIPGSVLALDRDTSEDRTIFLKNWENVIEEDGLHTLEIITETPFGVERLFHVTFSTDRQITINGAITDAELGY
jgi:hypothetical protein